MDYSFVIAIIPIILVVAFIAWIAKRITEGERIDMKEGIVGVVILMVAVLVMVPMISSTQVYTWDEDTGELVIQQNISGGSYAWDTYDDQIRSIVIMPGVTQIGNSAFDGATNINYLSIPGSVTDIGTNAFGVNLEDCFGNDITTPEPGQYVGENGTLYLCDDTIFTVNSSLAVTGLTQEASAAINLVIPSEYNGAAIVSINGSAFLDNTTIETLHFMPDSSVRNIYSKAFQHCSALFVAKLPDSLTNLGTYAFSGCSALTSIIIPQNVTTISGSAFRDSGAETVIFPASLTSISSYAFTGNTATTAVSFEEGFNPTLTNGWTDWVFYASDGITAIDKNTASNLAGKTFQGTAAALIEVEPGRLALTPQQIQQVHLHDTELQDLKDQISIEPLPLQPSLQEQELTA